MSLCVCATLSKGPKRVPTEPLGLASDRPTDTNTGNVPGLSRETSATCGKTRITRHVERPGVLIHLVAGPGCKTPLFIAVRLALKVLKRAFGLICIDIIEVGGLAASPRPSDSAARSSAVDPVPNDRPPACEPCGPRPPVRAASLAKVRSGPPVGAAVDRGTAAAETLTHINP